MTLAIAAVCAAALAAGNASFDHSLFDRLLKAHVAGGRVDYDAFARAPEFPRYLDALAHADPDALPEKEQIAFWINAYNAYTIQLVNAHGERESIRNIDKTLGMVKAMGPWREEIVKAGGKTMSLDFVENGILRKRFREPRIHVALVCAARSCPALRSEAYEGPRLDAQLDDQARSFIAGSPDKNRFDAAAATAYLSPIFGWYKADFGPDLGRFLARYVADAPVRALLESGRFKVVETAYDWSLNGK
jgi:hypothetical protein